MNDKAQKKTRVAVLMGGVSTEHEVSMSSGTNVSNALDKNRFTIIPVVIHRSGQWSICPALEADGCFSLDKPLPVPQPAALALANLQDMEVEICFIALHGPGGEDGTIQGFLDTAGMPYTGSGVLANATAMDKILTKHILAGHGLRLARDISMPCRRVAADVDGTARKVLDELGLPVVVKISNQGSSKNIAITRDESALKQALREISSVGGEMLIEAFLPGRELTCAVLDFPGEEQSRALPPTELIPKSSDWFDFHAKYTPGATEEITPAELDDTTTREVQRIAVLCHQALHCDGMSRTDLMLSGGELYVIEINTVPGMTGTSLVPQAAAAAGYDFPTFLDLMIRRGLERTG